MFDLGTVLLSLALFAPILAANQAAHVLRLLGAKDVPTYEPVFGENKTLLPWLMGPILAMWVFNFYDDPYFFRDGFVVGLGVIAGDHIKSAIKHSRWIGIKPGDKWFFDRIDFAIGGSLAEMWLYPWMSWVHALLIVAMAFPIHLIGNAVGHKLGWRKTPH